MQLTCNVFRPAMAFSHIFLYLFYYSWPTCHKRCKEIVYTLTIHICIYILAPLYPHYPILTLGILIPYTTWHCKDIETSYNQYEHFFIILYKDSLIQKRHFIQARKYMSLACTIYWYFLYFCLLKVSNRWLTYPWKCNYFLQQDSPYIRLSSFNPLAVHVLLSILLIIFSLLYAAAVTHVSSSTNTIHLWPEWHWAQVVQ